MERVYRQDYIHRAVQDTILQRGDKWILKYSDGREEEFTSRNAAEERERQVNYFRNRASKR